MAMSRTITRVVNCAIANGGHAVEVEVAFADATREWLRCDEHIAAQLTQTLIQVSALAEQARKAGPKQLLAVEMPYRATNLMVGVSADGSQIAMKIATAEGPPVVIAMPPTLARKAIERLSAQVSSLGKEPPSRTN